MRATLYLLVIVLANIVTAKFAPMKLGVFLIPYGTLFIGLTFIIRDLVQNQYGRTKTYILIATALILSGITSILLGDTLWIVFASTLSFVISETTDTEIYTRLKTTLAKRVFFSGIVGGTLDSAIFVIVGLSPIGVGFVPWEFVWMAILGQVIVKAALQSLALLFIRKG